PFRRSVGPEEEKLLIRSEDLHEGEHSLVLDILRPACFPVHHGPLRDAQLIGELLLRQSSSDSQSSDPFSHRFHCSSALFEVLLDRCIASYPRGHCSPCSDRLEHTKPLRQSSSRPTTE